MILLPFRSYQHSNMARRCTNIPHLIYRIQDRSLFLGKQFKPPQPCTIGILLHLLHRIISFADTYSLSMTRQVTASAAMTLAVLMSSLDKDIMQTFREMANNTIDDNSITHCSTFQVLPQSRNGTTAAARLIQPPCFQRRGQRKHAPQQATLLSHCHYSVSQLTVRSSSSDSDDSSEESPQPHDSSESVSQEVILAASSWVPL